MVTTMTTAFVLSGGGSLGAVQVGMLQALRERGVAPDILIGTSAGAMNVGFVAGHGLSEGSLEELAAIWRGLKRSTVFPIDPVRRVLAGRAGRMSLCSNAGPPRPIATNVPSRNLEDAAIPVHIVATDLLTGSEVLMGTGDALLAVLG